MDVYAKRVISDAGVINTLTALLPKEIASKSSKSCDFIIISLFCSAYIVQIGCKNNK